MWVPLPMRPDVPVSPDERRAAVERLLAWARAKGARWDGIAFVVDESGSARGVATRSLAVGESILTLPRALMIIDDELEDSTTGPLSLGDEPHPRDALATWLPLEAREPMSPWRAYLEALPVQLGGLPMFHDADDLAELDGTAAHALATDTRRDIVSTYDRLPPELRTRLSLADFAWGRAIVMSRAFHAPGTFEHRVALLPLVDIFNHRRDDTGWSYSPYDGNLVVRTERAIEAGDEVCFSYGNRSNSHLLVHFGFTLADNTANEASLVFDLPSSPPLRVRVGGIVDERFARALSMVRLLTCDPVERDRIVAGLTEPTSIPFLAGANEEAALDLLASVARRARAELDAYPRRASQRAWDQTCALVREGERSILDQIIELATAARAYARCTPAQWRATVAALPTDASGAVRMLRRYLDTLAGGSVVDEGRTVEMTCHSAIVTLRADHRGTRCRRCSTGTP